MQMSEVSTEHVHDTQVNNITMKLWIDRLPNILNFHQKTTFESLLESFLIKNNIFPQVTQYHVTIIDQYLITKTSEENVLRFPALIVESLIVYEHTSFGQEVNLNDGLVQVFNQHGDDLSLNLSNSNVTMLKNITAIFPILMIRDASNSTLANLSILVGTQINEKNEQNVAIIIIALLTFFFISILYLYYRARRKLSREHMTGLQHGNSCFRNYCFASDAKKEEIYNFRPSGKIIFSNKRALNLLRRILKGEYDSNEMIRSDSDIDSHEISLEDRCSLPLLSKNQGNVRRESIMRLDPKSKYLKSKHQQKRKRLRRLMKKTDKAVTVGNELSTIPETTSSIATSNCGSDVRCDNINIEEQCALTSAHQKEINLIEKSPIVTAGNEKLVKKTCLYVETSKAELRLEDGRIMENNNKKRYSELPTQIQSHPLDILNVKTQVLKTADSSKLLSHIPFSRSENSAFESFTKNRKRIVQIVHPVQTKSQQLQNNPSIEENIKSQNSNTTEGNESKVSFISDHLKPPMLLRIVNPSYVFGEEESNEISYVPSQETSIPTISSISDEIKSDTSSCLRAIKREYNDIQNQLLTVTDSEQYLNEIHSIFAYKKNLVKDIFVLNPPPIDNTSVSTISADTQASGTKSDKKALNKKEKKKSGKEPFHFDGKNKNKKIDESQDTATCSQSSSSQSSSTEGGWIDESNIHSITINDSTAPHLIFTDETPDGIK